MFFRYWVKKTNVHGRLDASSLNTDYPYVWHHVALVLKPNNRDFTVYHDGIAYGTASMSIYHSRGAGSGNVFISSQNYTHPPPSLYGEIQPTTPSLVFGMFTLDELVIWNEALSALHISQIFNMES